MSGIPTTTPDSAHARRQFDSWSHWYRRVLPAYWIALCCVTHFPKLSIPGHVPQSDKLAHASAYGVLAFLYWRFVQAVRRTPGEALDGKDAATSPAVRAPHRPGWAFAWAALAVIAAYAALDEYTQPWFGRDCDVTDWLVDVTGAAAVLALLEWRRRSAAAKGAVTL